MKFIKWIFSRVAIASILILLQLFLFFYLLITANRIGAYIYLAIDVLSVLITLYLINTSYEPTQKLSWLLFIIIFPVVGVPVYLLFSSNS
jgi:cardiolipin synthase